MNNYEELCELVKKLFDQLQNDYHADVSKDAWDMLYRMYDIANDKYPRRGGVRLHTQAEIRRGITRTPK